MMGLVVSCAVFAMCVTYLVCLIWVLNHELKEKDEKIAKLLKEIDKKDAIIKTTMDHIKSTEGKARKILESLEKVNV